MRRMRLIFLVMILPGMALCAQESVPYALSLLDKYPEFGDGPPPDICEGEVRNPCTIRTGVLYAALTNLETVRDKLNPEAWSALQRAAPKAREIWLFNVCTDKAREHPDCFAVFGVAALNKNRVTFYAFLKPKVYPD